MNTSFVYTFKTRKAVLNHLRALAQLFCSIYHSNFPLTDFEIDYPSIYKMLSYLERRDRKSLYFGFRVYGFEFNDSSMMFDDRMNSFSDCIASYVLTFENGYYKLHSYPVK